jgi:hypothetical protein
MKSKSRAKISASIFNTILSATPALRHYTKNNAIMASDDLVWNIIGNQFCSYKVKCVQLLHIPP